MAFVATHNSRITIGDREWSGDLTSVDSSSNVDVIETTTLADTSKNYIPGLNSGTLVCNGLIDSASASSANSQWQDLYAIRGDSDGVPAIVALEGFTADKKVWVAQVTETSWTNTSSVAGAVSFTLNLETTGDHGQGVSLFDPGTAKTATATGTVVDNSASSSTGAVANLCVVTASGTSPTLDVVIQHSADNVSYSTLITYTQATGTTSERKTVASGTTINRYLKVVATIGGTSPSFNFAVGLARL